MTAPAPVDPASITDDQLAVLRRLTTADGERLTDGDARALLASFRCPLRPGLPLGSTDAGPDTYAAAAAWWEGLALIAELPAGPVAAGQRVKSATVGDVTVTYAQEDGSDGLGDPARLWAVARRLSRRSCAKGARTVRLLPPDSARQLLRGGDLLAGELRDEYGDLLPAEASTLPAYTEPRTVSPADPVVNA